MYLLIFRCLIVLTAISKSAHAYRYDEHYIEPELGNINSDESFEIGGNTILQRLRNVAQSDEESSVEIQRESRSSRCFTDSHCRRNYEHCTVHGRCESNCKRRKRESGNSLNLDEEDFQLEEDEYERNTRNCQSIREKRHGHCYVHSHCGCNRRCNTCTHYCQYLAHRKH